MFQTTNQRILACPLPACLLNLNPAFHGGHPFGHADHIHTRSIRCPILPSGWSSLCPLILLLKPNFGDASESNAAPPQGKENTDFVFLQVCAACHHVYVCVYIYSIHTNVLTSVGLIHVFVGQIPISWCWYPSLLFSHVRHRLNRSIPRFSHLNTPKIWVFIPNNWYYVFIYIYNMNHVQICMCQSCIYIY